MGNDMGSPEDCFVRYRAMRVERPECFREPSDSPISILTTEGDIAAAQAEEAARRESKKQIAPDVRVGVLAADPYLGILARDAVRFADRSLGLYNRHIGEAGCAVMPRIGDEIVLIRIFRHAGRDWSWEFPGGYVALGENPDIAALHELEEEIGAIGSRLQALGAIHPYPAFSTSRIQLYAATIEGFGEPQSAEGIVSIEKVSAARLLQMANTGEITDAVALACILKAQLRGFI
jgi:ADP-ribose pyrophosphatase